MGVENNECVLATTWNPECVQAVEEFIASRDEDERSLFAIVPALCNGKTTIILSPAGSKKGWPESEKVARLRNAFIEIIAGLDYDDGSNPFDWVEVGYGEFGQKILRGNCKNKYDDSEYAGQ